MCTVDDLDILAMAVRSVEASERTVEELRNRPRFGGNEEAQRFWFGRTHEERIGELERQISLGVAAIRNMRNRLQV